MTAPPDPVLAMVSDVAELTRPMVYVQTHWVWAGGHEQRREHRFRHPSLLDQLRTAVDPTRGTGMATIRAGSTKQPAAVDLDAVECLSTITEEVEEWRHQFRLTTRGKVEDDMWALAGAVGSAAPGMAAHLAADVARWRSRARAVVGWGRNNDPGTAADPGSAPPAAATCPLCGASNSLRIRPRALTARCAACGKRWTPDTIGLLARHIADTIG